MKNVCAQRGNQHCNLLQRTDHGHTGTRAKHAHTTCTNFDTCTKLRQPGKKHGFTELYSLPVLTPERQNACLKKRGLLKDKNYCPINVNAS